MPLVSESSVAGSACGAPTGEPPRPSMCDVGARPCLVPTILHGTFRSMEQMQISEFKAKCLAVLARVGRTGNPVLITRFGKPVARIVPAARADRDAWLGSLRGSGKILDDLVEPVSSPDEWEALPS